MKAHEVRAWLAKQLRRPVPDDVWEALVEECFVAEALDDEIEDWQDGMRKRADELMVLKGHKAPAHKVPPRPGRQPGSTQHYTATLSSAEHDRAEVFSRYLASHANGLRAVRQFRATYLGGNPLSPEQALAFCASPAVRFLAREDFEALKIPIRDHQAQLLDQETGATPIEGSPLVERFHRGALQITWPGGTYTGPFGRGHHTLGRKPIPGMVVHVPGEDGGEQRIYAWSQTVLYTLGKLSKQLARDYMWHEAHAAFFVLTGDVPWVAPIEVSWRSLGRTITTVDGQAAWPLSLLRPRITIEVDAWMSVETVTQTYKAVQRHILQRDNCNLRARSRALVRFLVETTGDDRTPAQRLAAWNQQYPQWRYAEYGRLQAAFKRAEFQICFPEENVKNYRRTRRRRAVVPRQGASH
jgi:hypothetical protein